MDIHFTRHALDRMRMRGIAQEWVVDAVSKIQARSPVRREVRASCPGGEFEICCEITESHINIITVYWV
jgi:hypothetical protein